MSTKWYYLRPKGQKTITKNKNKGKVQVMTFITDRQTIKDLNITGKYNKSSIFSIYNKTVTRGGEKALEKMITAPFPDAADINNRVAKFRFFMKSGIQFPFSRDEFQQAEDYLINSGHKSFLTSFSQNLKRKAMKLIANEEEFDIMQNGIRASILFFGRMQDFVKELNKCSDLGYSEEKKQIASVYEIQEIKALINTTGNDFSFWKFCKYDYLLRHTCSERITALLKLIHKLDVYTSVANIAKNKNFTLATTIGNASTEDNSFIISIKDVFHPGLKNAKTNDICLSNTENLFFLTGANMAGKSTLMKSFAIAVYFAHIGFPIAASEMSFTAMQGLYTSINVPDNLNMGYSHFYAEVMRVKMISQEIAVGKKLVVLFDEMFKGTNVKDAYDATVCISECFTNNKKCAFIVSTHIMEAGLTLQKKCNGIKYQFLPTSLKNNIPEYTYALQDGVSDDHFGMLIVNKEKIIETIKESPEYTQCI